MYDKKYSEDYLAKYMWFSLIKWAIDNRLLPLNLGGGCDDWVECIIKRKEFPNAAYKWLYVPKDVKDNPFSQPAYYLSKKSKKLKLKSENGSFFWHFLFGNRFFK